MTVGQWLDLYDAGEREAAGRLLLIAIGRCSRGPAQRLRVDPDDLEDVVVERVTRGRGFAYLRAMRADVSLQGAMRRLAWLGACDIARARARRAGHLPDVWRLHRLGGSAGTCLERKLTTGLYGTPPAGGGEYACCCVYTYYENGESETVVYVDPACDRRVHKDSDGNPMPWNGAGGASDFSCVGSCVAGAHTCQVDVLSGPTQDGAVWKRKSKCNCQ